MTLTLLKLTPLQNLLVCGSLEKYLAGNQKSNQSEKEVKRMELLQKGFGVKLVS